MDEFEIENKIHELRSLIASDWPGIEERKKMYAERAELEALLEELKDAGRNPKISCKKSKGKI